MPGGELTAIEGIEDTTALVLVREIGGDMSRWPTGKHCASWLGLCPHPRVSGGKGLSRRTKLCAHRAATALRLAASCLPHRQSALGAFFRRMQARWGTPKAITATAQKLARLVYTLLKHGTAYVAQGLADDEQRDQERVLPHLTRRAKTLGYALGRTAEGAPAAPPGSRDHSLEGLLLSIGGRLPVRKSEAFFRPTQRAPLAYCQPLLAFGPLVSGAAAGLHHTRIAGPAARRERRRRAAPLPAPPRTKVVPWCRPHPLRGLGMHAVPVGPGSGKGQHRQPGVCARGSKLAAPNGRPINARGGRASCAAPAPLVRAPGPRA
jgi:hypothetical protein